MSRTHTRSIRGLRTINPNLVTGSHAALHIDGSGEEGHIVCNNINNVLRFKAHLQILGEKDKRVATCLIFPNLLIDFWGLGGEE